MSARAIALLGWLCCCWLPSSAAAEAPARLASITLIEGPCAVYDAAELERLLQLELAARAVGGLVIRERLDDVSLAGAGLAVVRLRCDAAHASVTAEVTDRTTGNQTRRELPLADLPPSTRARALSLAVTALIEGAWLELALRPPPAVPDALPAEVVHSLRERARNVLVPPTAAATVLRIPESALALLLAARSHPTRGVGLLGVELHYTPLLARTRLSVSAEALWSSRRVSDVDGALAQLHLYALGAGLSLTWASTTRPELSIGPCLRLGYAGARASELRSGAAAHSGGGFHATLGLLALLRAQLAGPWDLWLGLDLGYTLSGVVFAAGTSARTGLTDLTLALRAGLGARL